MIWIAASLAFLSLFLCYVAPNEYSYHFCLLLHNIFICYNILYFIVYKNEGIICFQFMFAIGFYFTNFFYPIFWYSSEYTFFSLFSYSFNIDIISYATSVAFLAFCFYMLGVICCKNVRINIPKNNVNVVITDVKRIAIALFIVFLSFLCVGGFNYFAKQYQEGEMGGEGSAIIRYLNLLVNVLSILLSIFILRKNIFSLWWGRIGLAILLLVIGGLLLAGSRTLPLALLLVLFVTFNDYRKKIPFFPFIICLFLGMCVMTFISFTRNLDLSAPDYLTVGFVFFDSDALMILGSDLIINNRNLYSLVDYADHNGYTYILTQLSVLLSPVPLLLGMVCMLFGINPMFVGSSSYNTYLALGNDPPLGLGTNAVADIYLSFGIIGVICCFFFLGFIIEKSKRLSKMGNTNYTIIYYSLVSSSIFMCRNHIFGEFRTIVWGILIIYLLRHLKLWNYKIRL